MSPRRPLHRGNEEPVVSLPVYTLVTLHHHHHQQHQQHPASQRRQGGEGFWMQEIDYVSEIVMELLVNMCDSKETPKLLILIIGQVSFLMRTLLSTSERAACDVGLVILPRCDYELTNIMFPPIGNVYTFIYCCGFLFVIESYIYVNSVAPGLTCIVSYFLSAIFQLVQWCSIYSLSPFSLLSAHVRLSVVLLFMYIALYDLSFPSFSRPYLQ